MNRNHFSRNVNNYVQSLRAKERMQILGTWVLNLACLMEHSRFLCCYVWLLCRGHCKGPARDSDVCLHFKMWSKTYALMELTDFHLTIINSTQCLIDLQGEARQVRKFMRKIFTLIVDEDDGVWVSLQLHDQGLLLGVHRQHNVWFITLINVEFKF